MGPTVTGLFGLLTYVVPVCITTSDGGLLQRMLSLVNKNNL